MPGGVLGQRFRDTQLVGDRVVDDILQAGPARAAVGSLQQAGLVCSVLGSLNIPPPVLFQFVPQVPLQFVYTVSEFLNLQC